METSLEFMTATAERFDSITVRMKKKYYNGVSRSFFLRDNTMKQLINCTIMQEQFDKGSNEQIYQIEVPELNLSHDYEVENAYGLTCPLIIKGIVNDPKFDQKFYYGGDDLGPTYTSSATEFKVWAPTSSKVMLEYHLKGETNVVVMKRQDRGVYYCKVEGDLDGADYVYLVKNDGVILEATDPYAYSGTINSKRSSVIDLNKIVHDDVDLPPMKQKTDAIIYEISIRDISSSVYSGIIHGGKFLGLTETGTTTVGGNTSGLDYIQELGVTHVQIMPMFDFGSVDEIKPQMLYNWGYDPNQYNIPEGSYSLQPDDPYSRVQECVMMVEAFHKAGLRVSMDVVFNHVYSVNNHPFERIVPHYYIRNDDFGNISDGSFCSNDINSGSLMVRKYIIDMCKRWIQLYHVDAYRFDLMGILDVFTMNEIERACHDLDPSFMVYGEGWDLPTMLSDQDKAKISNHAKMPRISFFNDRFRDTIRGQLFNNNSNQQGYMTGNSDKTGDACMLIKNISMFSSPDQSINYVECHDNETAADKLIYSIMDVRETRQRRLVMMMGACIFSIGIPFLHSGQEFYRSKNGLSNTYNAPDDINQIKWQIRDRSEPQIQLIRDMIKIRKDNPGLRYSTNEEVTRYVQVYQEERTIIYEEIMQPDHENEKLIIIYNPSNTTYKKKIESGLEVLFTLPDTNNKLEDDQITVDSVSMIVLAKKRLRLPAV